MITQIRRTNFRKILIIMVVTIFLHAWAVALLPQDYDEPIYLQTAFDYANAIKAGNVNAVIDNSAVREHPALVKLIYALDIIALGKYATWTNAFYLSRAVSAFFGSLAVLATALLVDPLSAGLLGVHTLAVKYTSQVYLEALPHFLSIVAILTLIRANREQRDTWFWISAFALGAATAGKFTYIPVAVLVLVYIAWFEKKISLEWLIIYGTVALAVFFALDVTLWHNPIGRLMETLSFHLAYSKGTHVQTVGYPWYQPFIWIFTSAPAEWHPNVFFYFGFDGLISAFAVAGVRHEWQHRRWLVIWLGFGLLFLLLWPTKWPQYVLSITPALCIMAAESMRRLVHWAREQENYWDYLSMMLPEPSKWMMWITGIFVGFIGIVYFSAAVKLAVGRIGWSHMTAESSLLPSNTIHDLLPRLSGEMVIATERGVAFWYPPPTTDQPDRWQIFTSANSSLPNDTILSLARASDDALWFGTQSGLARYDGTSWMIFHAVDLGLSTDRVNALAAGPDGQIYAGTLNGAALWNGNTWRPINSLNGKQIFGLNAANGILWVAAFDGVYSVNLESRQTSFYPTRAAAMHIIVDSKGIVWAATSDGVAQLENGTWKYFDTTNSGLPLNLVTTMTEVTPGNYWFAMANSAKTGGLMASFDGGKWYSFNTDNSGFSGSEPLVIVKGGSGQVWIGTRTHGLDMFRLEK